MWDNYGIIILINNYKFGPEKSQDLQLLCPVSFWNCPCPHASHVAIPVCREGFSYSVECLCGV